MAGSVGCAGRLQLQRSSPVCGLLDRAAAVKGWARATWTRQAQGRSPAGRPASPPRPGPACSPAMPRPSPPPAENQRGVSSTTCVVCGMEKATVAARVAQCGAIESGYSTRAESGGWRTSASSSRVRCPSRSHLQQHPKQRHQSLAGWQRKRKQRLSLSLSLSHRAEIASRPSSALASRPVALASSRSMSPIRPSRIYAARQRGNCPTTCSLPWLSSTVKSDQSAPNAVSGWLRWVARLLVCSAGSSVRR